MHRQWGHSTRQLARQIDREAQQQALPPGARLASEPTLITFFNTSRGTLRQALRLLGFLGRVESRFGPGGGTVITEPDHTVAASALAVVFQSRGVTMGAVLDTLATLQPAAASLAAKVAKDDALDEIVGAARALREPYADTVFVPRVIRFEAAVAAASGNEALAMIAAALLEMAALIDSEAARGGRRRYLDEVDDVVAAIQTGDAELASTLLAASWARRIKHVERRAPEAIQLPITWADVDESLERRPEGWEQMPQGVLR